MGIVSSMSTLRVACSEWSTSQTAVKFSQLKSSSASLLAMMLLYQSSPKPIGLNQTSKKLWSSQLISNWSRACSIDILLFATKLALVSILTRMIKSPNIWNTVLVLTQTLPSWGVTPILRWLRLVRSLGLSRCGTSNLANLMLCSMGMRTKWPRLSLCHQDHFLCPLQRMQPWDCGR